MRDTKKLLLMAAILLLVSTSAIYAFCLYWEGTSDENICIVCENNNTDTIYPFLNWEFCIRGGPPYVNYIDGYWWDNDGSGGPFEGTITPNQDGCDFTINGYWDVDSIKGLGCNLIEAGNLYMCGDTVGSSDTITGTWEGTHDSICGSCEGNIYGHCAD